MVRRVILFSLLAGLMLMPSLASANALVFTFTGGHGAGLVQFTTGPGGLLSNQVPTLTQKVSPATLTGAQNSPSGPSFTGANLGGVGFTTGSWVSTVGSLFTYGGGGNITITANGSGFGGAIPANTVLFSGVFSGNSTFFVTTPNPLQPKTHIGNLSGKVITTSLSPALLALLGMPFQSHGTAVALAIDVKIGTGGVITAGTVTLVPEPGTLALFGTGLVGLAGLLRRRLS